MSKNPKYLLVSLPTSISPSHHQDEALEALRNTVTNDAGTTYPFAIPTFKVGTLDALVQQADELAKLHNVCESVVTKVGDSLKSILDGDEEKLQQQKTINDKPVDQYLRSFQWNKVKYRADKPIADLIDSLQKVGFTNEMRNARTGLTCGSRKLQASTTTSKPNSASTTKSRPV